MPDRFQSKTDITQDVALRHSFCYHVSQAVLQSRKEKAGQVFRVPAPEVEAVIGRFLRNHCRDQQTDLRSLVEAQVTKIIIEEDFISVKLTAPDTTRVSPAQTVSLPWSKRPFRLAKGVVAEPTSPAISADYNSKAREAVLTAINRARHWVDQLMAGSALSEIAIQEGKSPRYIRLLTSLAFIPQRLMNDIINGDRLYTATELAGRVFVIW